jgi:two-component system, NarL family, nitrate/nitrite response regulator NarL
MDTNANHAIRVFVVASPMFRWGLTRLIESEGDGFHLVGEAESLDGAIDALPKHQIDLLLLDMDVQGHHAILLKRLPLMRQVAVLALSSAEPGGLDWALMNGLRGVVRKTDQPRMVLEAIRKVHEGQIWVDRDAMRRVLSQVWRREILPLNDDDRARLATLTEREKQTISALTSDASVPCKVIAHRLRISEHTLRNHLTSIYAKLELRSRVDLYAFASNYGLQALGGEPRHLAGPQQAAGEEPRTRQHLYDRSEQQGNLGWEVAGGVRRQPAN